LFLLFVNAGSKTKKLGTAVVCLNLGQQFRVGKPEQIYLCGLLHDIGLLANGLLFLEDFRDVLEEAAKENAPLEEVEQLVLGFTHAEGGRILAELWKLPVEIAEAIEHHHHPDHQKPISENTVLVHVADQICQSHGMGYGYETAKAEATHMDQLWHDLTLWIPQAADYLRDQYGEFVKQQLGAARKLVDEIFAPSPVAP
jgi:HD-like signal output (HDOD) protein